MLQNEFSHKIFISKPNPYRMLIGIGLLFVTVCCSTTADAKIDPETVAGIWLFDEADLKTLMEEGVGRVLGVAPVEPTGKLATMWAI